MTATHNKRCIEFVTLTWIVSRTKSLSFAQQIPKVYHLFCPPPSCCQIMTHPLHTKIHRSNALRVLLLRVRVFLFYFVGKFRAVKYKLQMIIWWRQLMWNKTKYLSRKKEIETAWERNREKYLNELQSWVLHSILRKLIMKQMWPVAAFMSYTKMLCITMNFHSSTQNQILHQSHHRHKEMPMSEFIPLHNECACERWTWTQPMSTSI